MKIFKKYLFVLLLLLKKNFSQFVQYRTNMIIRFMSCIVEMFLILYFFDIIFRNTSKFCGWNQGQTNFLICTYEIVHIILIGFFIKSLPRLEDLITDGKLDYYIIKPISSQFIISFQNISFGHLVQIFIPLILLIVQIHKYNIYFDIFRLVTYFFMLIFGFFIGYALWVIIVSISFWTVKVKSVHEIFLNIMDLGKYPAKIYPTIVLVIFKYFFPILFIASVPSELFLYKNNFFILLESFMLAVFFVLLSHFIWKLGINRYTSSGG